MLWAPAGHLHGAASAAQAPLPSFNFFLCPAACPATLLPPLPVLQTESYWGNVNPIGERSCYDEGKRAAECLTMDYHREHAQEVS